MSTTPRTVSPSPEPVEVRMRDRANSAMSDVLMSDPLDTEAENPETDLSEYSHDMDQDPQDYGVSTPIIDKATVASPLFCLPRELRSRIYAYCLSQPYAIPWPSDRCAAGLQVQLLRTCSAIFHEAAPMLYSSNMLHFQHPSDCNMFLWVHNPIVARLVTKILIQVRDKDVRSLWAPYLGSTSVSRSLLNDYPHLQTLHVQLKSSFLLILNANLEERFKRWDMDKHLRDLCLSLEGRTPDTCDVKVLVCTRTSARDVQQLLESFPEDLKKETNVSWRGEDDGSITARTAFRPIFRAQVALELEGTPLLDRIMGP
ncbi:hypothetical protein EJ08DRAFT_421685 [Tothia fuscella]|uniref:F-box domain-containing protein n=1 Tax=Tothia fuscella TaxID=1048955 RepID=A0A9P4NJI8_9PEZI|nr:hypothetical protein EJ08DRAFT_421685 [Tothia fuscella]